MGLTLSVSQWLFIYIASIQLVLIMKRLFKLHCDSVLSVTDLTLYNLYLDQFLFLKTVIDIFNLCIYR